MSKFDNSNSNSEPKSPKFITFSLLINQNIQGDHNHHFDGIQYRH